MKFPGLLLFWLLTVLGLSVGAAAVANGGVPPDTASLRRRIGAAGLDDSTKVRLLAELCYSLRETQPERALAYGEAAVVRARNLPEPGQAPLLLKALLNLATSYANLSNGPQALVLLNEAEELARSTANNDALTRTYAAQGSIYHERADSTTAWRHYQRALKLAQQEDVTPRTRMKLYGNVGSLFSFRQEYARALHFDSLALGLARRWRDSTAEANYLSSLATFQMHNGNLPRAKRLLTQALAISRRQNAVRNQANQLILFALYYLKNGEPERAESATREGLRLARQSGYLERVLDAYSILASRAADSKDFAQAYNWNSRYIALNDSLNSRQLLQTLASTQASYETQERLRRIRSLTEQQQLQATRSRLLAAAVIMLALALGVVGYLYRNLRRSRAQLSASHAALTAASAELRAVALFKDKLYAIVAHDLRGPVTAFAGVTSLIDSYIQENNQAELARLPGIVRQAADSLNQLLDNVLNWAVSQTGELACRPERLPVAELFAECKALYQTTAEAGRQHITSAAPGSLSLMVDHNMARTVLRNLVGNALKFMPPGGQVHLEADPDPADPRMVLVSCTDTGPGMTPATVSALMSGPALPSPTTLPRSTGLGLGLSLCRAFVHRHGGTLVIQSRPGAGTNVTVSLPAAPAPYK